MTSGLQQWLDENRVDMSNEVTEGAQQETVSMRQIITNMIECMNRAEHDIHVAYKQASQMQLYEGAWNPLTLDFENLKESLYFQLGQVVYHEEHSL